MTSNEAHIIFAATNDNTRRKGTLQVRTVAIINTKTTKMISSTSTALKFFYFLAFALQFANGFKKCGAGAYDFKTDRCCFRQNGDGLRNAVKDYHQNGGENSTAGKIFGTVFGDWCVDYVRDFQNAFFRLSNFNEPLTNWNTKSAGNMNAMFYFASSFNQPVNFDTSKVELMGRMFENAHAFNHPVH
jgi:hypothetical protein